MSGHYLAAIEAGGTKFICAVSDARGKVLKQVRFPTRTPKETLADIAQFFEDTRVSYGKVGGVGIGSFGPLDLDQASPRYGHIVSTPKEAWDGTDLLGQVAAIANAPVRIDTDVTTAAIAEGLYGAAKGLKNFCYVTVGTGIGVGAVINGEPFGGTGHLEAGHMSVARAPDDEDFQGICPYHWSCLEGLASGPAIQARWDMPASDLPEHHRGWDIEANYIAKLCLNLTYILRPQRIILGGGVFQRTSMYQRTRSAFVEVASSYALSTTERDVASYIAAPGLHSQPPGLVGAFELAKAAAADGVLSPTC